MRAGERCGVSIFIEGSQRKASLIMSFGNRLEGREGMTCTSW